jgi:tetratricopeptide (TPR) repeat protein
MTGVRIGGGSVRLPSGKTIKEVVVGPLSLPNWHSGPMTAWHLSYTTAYKVDDIVDLNNEIADVWVVFRPQADKTGYPMATITAQEPPKKPGFITTTKIKNYVFVKESGNWRCNNDKTLTDKDSVLRKCFQLLQENRLSEALPVCTWLITAWPNNPQPYSNRAVCYKSIGQSEKALADADKAVSLDPTNPLRYANRSAAFLDLNQYSKCIADCDKAISMQPSHFGALLNRGIAEIKIDKLQAAVDDLTSALKYNPKLGEAFYYRAVAYEKLGKVELAQVDREKAKELNYKEGTSTITVNK